MGFRVAVVGATGNVGRELLTTLAEREFPADDVVALASSRSIGREVSFGEDDVLNVQGLDTYDFRGIDIVLSSPGAKVSEVFAPTKTTKIRLHVDAGVVSLALQDVPRDRWDGICKKHQTSAAENHHHHGKVIEKIIHYQRGHAMN